MTSQSAENESAASPPTSSLRDRVPVLPLWGVVVTAGLVLIVAGLREVADIVAPIFLIVTLVMTVQPLRKILIDRRAPRWLASVIVLFVIFLMMGTVLGAVVLSITQLIQLLPQYEQAFIDLYEGALALLQRFGLDPDELPGLVSQIDIGSITGAVQTVLQQLLSGLTSGASLITLMVLTAIFMAFDASGARERLQTIKLARPTVAAAFHDFAVRVRRYWIVTTAFGVIVASIDVIALWIIGVPLALTWGVLAFVSNYIPNVGFIIGVIPPALIALLDGGWKDMVAVIIAYSVINFTIQTLIQPRFTGDAAGINATVAFISLIFWASILGLLGALLAVPATLFVKVMLIDHSENARWFGALINSSNGTKVKPRKQRRLRRVRHGGDKVPEPAPDKPPEESAARGDDPAGPESATRPQPG